MQKWNFSFALNTLTSLLVLTQSAYAATPVLPGSVQPGVLGHELTQQQLSTEAAAAAPETAITEPQKQSDLLPESVRKITFRLDEVKLEGNHVYTTPQLEFLYKRYLHKTITIADAFDITQAITNYYRDTGYILSRAILPVQKIENGLMRIQVIEGFIDQVHVVAKPWYLNDMVLKYGNQIKANRPLQISQMEKYLLLANQIPGAQVKAELSPSERTPGSADLALLTQNQVLTGYFSYDNYGTRYIGPQEMTANIGINSWFTSGDSFNVTRVKTPVAKEITYTDVNYWLPINPLGTRMQFGETQTSTHPQFVLEPADISSIDRNYYTLITYPFITSRAGNLLGRVGFNYHDTSSTALHEPLYTDHIRKTNFGLTYNFADRWSGINLLVGDIHIGLPIFGYSSDTNINTAQTSRPGGHADYVKVTASGNRTQQIKGAFSIYGGFQGQFSGSALLSSDQFSYGGSNLGRAYDIAQFLGDNGLAGTLELRYDRPIEKLHIQALQFYAFYDAGMIWNFYLIGGSPKKASGTSTGLGARFGVTKYLSGNIMWAQPLTTAIASEEILHRGFRPVVLFSMTANF